MVFRVDRRRHLHTYRAGGRNTQGTLRREKIPDRAAWLLPDGKMMEVVLGESSTIHGCRYPYLTDTNKHSNMFAEA